MVQKENLTFKCADGISARRFVKITASTDSVAYPTAGGAANAVTLGNEKGGVVAVQLLKDVTSSFFFDALGTIAIGDSVQAGTNGTGIKKVNGIELCKAKSSAISGSVGTGYNF